MTYTEAQKNGIYKYRSKHREEYLAYTIAYVKKYQSTEEYKYKDNQRKKRDYRYKIECIRLRNIELF